MNHYPHETNEFAPITVKVNNVTPPVTDIEYQVTVQGARPTLTGWALVTVVGDEFGFMVTGFATGVYDLWARINNTTGTPILKVDEFKIT